MIQTESRLKVADNSGVQEVLMIRVVGRGYHRYAGLGDQIICSARQVTSSSPIPRGSVVRGVVVRVKSKTRRPDGSQIAFDENAVVIIDDQKNPRATRVFGPVARELREREYMKIVSLAPEVV